MRILNVEAASGRRASGDGHRRRSEIGTDENTPHWEREGVKKLKSSSIAAPLAPTGRGAGG
jgi:hypothetical protein